MEKKQPGKRTMDLILALGLLLGLWPIMLFSALLVRISMGTPVLYRQSRPGLAGRPFALFKFRTMREERDELGKLKEDHERVTGVGMLLRKTSLDELPQLWNVLRGEMSLVGPRPLLMEYLKHYTPEQLRRHEVMPGITGWAQIHGRNQLPFSARLEYDLWYVENWSLRLDLKILARTVWKVLCTRGVKLEQIEEIDDLGLHPESRNSQRI